MSHTPIAFVANSVSSLCGRELLVLAFPEYEGFIRNIAGLFAGALFRFSNREDEPLLGFGVCIFIDLIVTENVAWAIMPAMGWLITSIGLRVGSNSPTYSSERTTKRTDRSLDAPPIGDFAEQIQLKHLRPGSLIHTRFREVPGLSGRLASEAALATLIHPPTSENTEGLSPVDADGNSTVRENSVDTEFETASSASVDASLHTHSPNDASPILELLPQGTHLVYNSQGDLVGSKRPDSVDNRGATPVTETDGDERDNPAVLLHIDPLEEVASLLHADEEQLETLHVEPELQANDARSEDLICKTASPSSTVCSSELEGTSCAAGQQAFVN